MKKLILYIIMVCLPFISGCGDVNIYSAHSEPEELVVIKTIGIDYKDGAVTVTAAAGTTSDGKKPEVYTSSASTLAEAVNGIQNGYLGNEAYFSHAEQIILGEEAAKYGITEFLDYIGRNVYMRMSSDLYVVKGDTAQKLMEDTTGSDVTTSDMLESIGERSEFMASGRVFTGKDVMAGLAEAGAALVYVIEKGEPLMVGSDDEMGSIKPVGYALFKDGAMTEYLDSGVTEGAGIIMGHTKSGMLTVEAQEHGAITLRITDVKTKYDPVYRDGEMMSVTLNVTAKMNIEEAGSDLKFINDKLREEIEAAAAEEIRQTVILAIEKSQELEVDFCGIGDSINLMDPYKFRSTHEKWQNVFADTEIDLKVKTNLQRTYDMEDSLNFTGDE